MEFAMRELMDLTGITLELHVERLNDRKDKIAKLEAEADPWRRAKSAVEYFRGFADHKQAEHDVVAYVDHLEARVAELEAHPVPPLDLARVWATTWQDIKEPEGWRSAEPYPLEGES
jgi:hypothetical protein